MPENYYLILEVSFTATKQEIKKSFRRLALKLHPDKNKSPNAHDQFIRINEAYLILTDEEARSRYDLIYSKYFLGYKKPDLETETVDPIFQSWKANAREQAETYSNLSFEKFSELVKSIKDDLIITGTKSIFYALSRTLVLPGIGGIIGSIYYQNLIMAIIGFVFCSISYFGIKHIKSA